MINELTKSKADKRIEELVKQFSEALSLVDTSTLKKLAAFNAGGSLFDTAVSVEIDKDIDTDYFWETLNKEVEKVNIAYSVEGIDGEYPNSTRYNIELSPAVWSFVGAHDMRFKGNKSPKKEN